MSETTQQYQPGDVVNGYVLGEDGAWHPVPGHSWGELQTFLPGVGLKTDRVDPVEPGLGTAWLSRA